LAPPKLEKPFEIVFYASNIGLGAVLLQDGLPVAFEIRKAFSAIETTVTIP
jgi:hypothetical protein